MRLPVYPVYKDSGVEWLRDLPAHWKVRSLKHVVSTPITDGPHETPVFLDVGIPFVSAEAVASGEINFSKIRAHISLEDQRRYSAKYVPKRHDIYMVKSGATTGVTAIVETDIEFNIWSPLAAIRCDREIANPYFVLNFLRSRNFQEAVTLNWSFGTQQNIGMGVLGNLSVALPPLEEQLAIATFLRRETFKIDGLISEQEKLITLLAEKHQATISRAVTKGLNPNAPMKDSGVEWLGSVPKHWDVSPIKYVARVGNGSTPNRDEAKYWSEGSYPWLNSSVVNQDKVTQAEQFVTELALRECHLPVVVPPAVLVGITGQGRTRGMAATLLFEATINQHVVYIKPRSDRLNVHFLRRVFDMAYQYLRSESDSAGSTKGAITCDQILRLTVPFPGIDEQAMIVSFLDDETARLDALTNEASRGIALLQERRSALISAAVTGKIDVRQVAQQEQATIQKAA
jgi:type I restriction enzyme S subunit